MHKHLPWWARQVKVKNTSALVSNQKFILLLVVHLLCLRLFPSLLDLVLLLPPSCRVVEVGALRIVNYLLLNGHPEVVEEAHRVHLHDLLTLSLNALAEIHLLHSVALLEVAAEMARR